MRRQKESVGDLPVAQPFRDQTHHAQFRFAQALPCCALRVKRRRDGRFGRVIRAGLAARSTGRPPLQPGGSAPWLWRDARRRVPLWRDPPARTPVAEGSAGVPEQPGAGSARCSPARPLTCAATPVSECEMFWSAKARVESITTRACCGHAAVARWSWGGGSSKIWYHAAIGNNESSSDARPTATAIRSCLALATR